MATRTPPLQLFFLRINFSKSMMIPIDLTEEKLNHLARTFRCQPGSFPFTYLGRPLGTSRPKVDNFLPLISKCERRLSFVSPFLSPAGRLELTNSVLTALPTFTMCSIVLPKTVIKQIDKYRRHCLWRGASQNEQKVAKAAWPVVCLPKDEGGLGILDIQTQNEALILKHLHKFFNKQCLPWVELIWDKHYRNGKVPNINTPKGSFWWRDALKTLDKYKGMGSIYVENGKTCLLWDDLWHGQVRKLQYPEFHSFAKNKSICLSKATESSGVVNLFNLPLSVEAFNQLQELQSELHNLELTDMDHKWHYIWGSNRFSSAQAYKQLVGHSQVDPIFKRLWKTSCQGKHKIFFWLILKDRLSIRNMIRRRGMDLEDYNCVFCQHPPEETLMHLLFYCPYAKLCWNIVGFDFDDDLTTLQIFNLWGSRWKAPFSLDIFIIWCWGIWMVRNDTVFKNTAPSVAACKFYIVEEVSLLLLRTKERVTPLLESWILSNL
jgi:hypothetical protein